MGPQIWQLAIMVRTVLYNPLSATDGFRLEEISSTFRSIDFVFLPGTQGKQFDDVVTQRPLEHHAYYHWGWSRGRHTNRSAGIGIGVGKRWRKDSVKQIWSPPKGLQGRGGALRVRQEGHDYTLLGAYFPPRCGPVDEYKSTVLRLASWVEQVLRETPRRSVPVLAVDLNDGVGMEHQTSRRLVPCDDGTVGEFGLSPGHFATEQLKDIVETYDLAYLETFNDAGPTFFGNKTSSYIDHILAPKGLTRDSRAWTSRRAMRILQLIPTVAPRDHCPLFVEFRPCRGVPANETQKKQKAVDRDAMMKALRTGEGREAFVTSLKKNLTEIDQEEWDRASKDMYPDGNWRTLREALNQATTQAFPKVAKKTSYTRSSRAKGKSCLRRGRRHDKS